MATGSLTQTSDEKKGHAVIGCLLKNRDDKGPTYSMVNRHVTKASKGLFFLEKDFKRKIAKSINNSSSRSENLKKDVDLVKFTKSSQGLVQPVYRNFRGKITEYSLYEGTVGELKDAQIFQAFRPKGEKETISKQGRVIEMSDDYKILKKLLDPESNFIVGDSNGKSFADKGDSGRVVAREIDGRIELVGIITWGQYECRDNHEKPENTCISICMLLKHAIQYLNEKYKLDLSLIQPEVDNQVADTDDNDASGDKDNDNVDPIEPGQILYFPANV
jgi:hypothetical protein